MLPTPTESASTCLGSLMPLSMRLTPSLRPLFILALAQERLRERARRLLPADWNQRFLPHYFARYAHADFHADLHAACHNLHLTRGVKLSTIAPRGGAKSTLLTLAYPLRCALEGWEPYIAILSDSSEQANDQLRHIRVELEANPHLAAVYPDEVGEGTEWKDNKLRLRNGVVIEAFGSGKKIRGRRNRAERPTLIVFDDAQSNADVTSEVLRERAWDWATREVIPAGDERTNFLAVGSALHREAVSVRLGTLAGWTGRTYPAIIQWPVRLDLWDEFERLATNLADPHKLATAREYYAARAAEMDAGAVVYWPARHTLCDLMLRRAEIGHAAFAGEYQGVPGSGANTEWPGEFFDRADLWFDEWPDDLVVKLQSLDPSKGASDKSDYQAHVCLALSRFGTLYADCQLHREAKWVERAIDIAAAWKPLELIAEANNTMGLMGPAADQILTERAAAKTPVLLNYNERVNTVKKEVRIRVLNEYLRRGQLKVRNTTGGRMMVDQLRAFPDGRHDDAPDALATAVIRMQELVG